MPDRMTAWRGTTTKVSGTLFSGVDLIDTTIVMRALVPALVFLSIAAAGCNTCGFGSNADNVYDGNLVRQGDVTAPSAWGLPTTIDNENAGTSCARGEYPDTCAMSGTCDTICFSVQTAHGPPPGNAMVWFPFVASALPWNTEVLLPDDRVEVNIAVSTDDPAVPRTLALVSGIAQVSLHKNEFDAHFALDAVAPDGQHLTLASGRYAFLNGHWKTECRKGD